VAAAVRSAIWEIDNDLPVSRVQSMESVRAAAIATQRFNLILMGLFACLALALAVTGVYGVTAYSVAQRTREIGVRMALGAQATDVVRLVLTQSLKLIIGGIVTGVISALALTRLMTNLLFGISPSDPLTFAAISLLLTGVALVACFVPARRATRVDPLVALRYE
jgi:ABC-type antimicrobial peptide transport system permease subunit